jgi:GNAT superfamily N-acetyltransferase
MTLYDVLAAAAAGRPPEPDGTVEVLARQGPAAAVVAFSAHFVVAADVEPEWVRGQLPDGDWSAPHGARFLVALADRIGADVGALDVVLARTAGPADESLQLAGIEQGAGHVLVGRGLAGRWEMAFEVEPGSRGAGLGRRLAAAAAGLVPAGELTWAQVSPGHPASLRSVLAAGYRPVCAEVLLPPRR